MPKMPEDRGTQEQYEETVHPDNPPRASAAPAAVVAGMWYVLGPVAALILALLVALWMFFGGNGDAAEEAMTTLPGAEPTVGAGDPRVAAPDAGIGGTRDEIEFRGAGDGTLGPPATPSAGSRVDLESAEVVGVGNGADFWIERNGQRVAVIAPQNAPEIRTGMRVNVSGTVEDAGQGQTRIRATQVAVR